MTIPKMAFESQSASNKPKGKAGDLLGLIVILFTLAASILLWHIFAANTLEKRIKQSISDTAQMPPSNPAYRTRDRILQSLEARAGQFSSRKSPWVVAAFASGSAQAQVQIIWIQDVPTQSTFDFLDHDKNFLASSTIAQPDHAANLQLAKTSVVFSALLPLPPGAKYVRPGNATDQESPQRIDR